MKDNPESPQTTGVRTAVLPMNSGEVTISFPEEMTEEDWKGFEDYLSAIFNIFKKVSS